MTAGYSGTPLAIKLGVRPEYRVGTFAAPASFPSLLEPLPPGASVVRSPRSACPVLIVFATTAVELDDRFTRAIRLLPADGALWLAWPKRTSGIATELGEATVQEYGLEAGLVDNKVAAIDETWSGLRFVVRVEDRAGWAI